MPMSTLDKDKKNITEAPEELTTEDLTPEEADSLEESDMETLTLEDLELDVSEPSINFTATLHFEFSDIFNAVEHIELEEPETDAESEDSVEEEPETDAELEELAEETKPETDAELEEPAEEPEPEPEELVESITETEQEDLGSEVDQEEEPEFGTAETTETEVVSEPEPEDSAEETEPETDAELDKPAEEPEQEAAPLEVAKPKQNLISRLKGQDKGTKKLVVTDIILLLIIVISITAGLIAANSLVDKANAANEAKIAEMQENIKEVNLAGNLYDMAADQVIDDVAVPTYTLEQLYALDLRKPTGFTANDLKKITRKGLVGCEEAFVKAEQTYGVNSIFLMSIASLESAYGTQMFRPNNMFGYGRTGFSSKQEGIMTVAKGLGTRYLPPGGSLYGGSPTLKGVNKRYAANPQWYYKVGKYMQGYYAELAAEKNGALDKFE